MAGPDRASMTHDRTRLGELGAIDGYKLSNNLPTMSGWLIGVAEPWPRVGGEADETKPTRATIRMLQRNAPTRPDMNLAPCVQAGLTTQIRKLQDVSGSRLGLIRCGSSGRTVSDDGYLRAEGR